MDKKKLILLLGALVVAIGTALAARSMFAGAAAPQAQAAPQVPQGPKVLVAQRALPVGTIITADSISFQAWPKEMIQDAYFIDGEADMNKLLGTVVRYPVTAGQPVTQGALVSPGDRGFLAAALGPGMRAVTIPVSQKTGVGGFVFPGDHVDLVLTQSVRGLAALAVMFAIYAAITISDPMAKRVKSLNERREQLKSGILTQTAKKRASLVRKHETADKMKDTLSSLKVLQQSQLVVIQQKLAQAGIRKKELGIVVIFARMVLPIVLGGVVGFVVYGINFFPEWGGMKRLMALTAAVGLGYKGPEIYISNLISKRTDAIRKGLPDALDLLVICAEAGLTVDAAFNRVARELGRAYPELGDEFALTAIELSFLSERRQAFENLAWRVNLDAVKGVTTTMVQTERYGTPLASALRVLSAEFRNERMMRAEEKAARLPAIMTVPLILFILPVLFVVILGPAACSIADAFSTNGPTKVDAG
jgi:tight adherence protein C